MSLMKSIFGIDFELEPIRIPPPPSPPEPPKIRRHSRCGVCRKKVAYEDAGAWRLEGLTEYRFCPGRCSEVISATSKEELDAIEAKYAEKDADDA